MDLLQTLVQKSGNTVQLSYFLATHRQKVYDYFLTQPYETLDKVKFDIERYILDHLSILTSLDTVNRDFRVFLTLLLDVSIRFSLYMAVEQLYRKLNSSGCELSNRHRAAALYFTDINYIDDYFDRVDGLVKLLDESSAEDTEERIVETMIVCLLQVIWNFNDQNPTGVIKFKQLLLGALYRHQAFFTDHIIFQNILNYDLSQPNFDGFVHKQLDRLLGRHFVYNPSRELIIEKGSEYCVKLKDADADFGVYRAIAAQECSHLSDDVFYSLNRGVAILDEEKQLFMYLYSYGKMHHAKIIDAIQVLPLNSWAENSWEKPVSLFDWGCGQALASMAFFDYIKELNCDLRINRVTLIEPSELALERAALHVKKYDVADESFTVNREVDLLRVNDLSNRFDDIKVHLLSNIIDVDYFSLDGLISLIKQSFTGINYFVCVSPYINELKLARIDSFVDAFSTCNNFECLKSENAKAGEWQKSWTKVIRVFLVNL